MRAFLATPKPCPVEAETPASSFAAIADQMFATLMPEVPAMSEDQANALGAANQFAAYAPAEHPDTVLLALGRELEQAWRAERNLPADPTDAQCDAAREVCRAVVDQIMGTPATTIDGLQVKVMAYLWCGHEIDEKPEDLYDTVTTDVQVVASIIRDLSRSLPVSVRDLAVWSAT